MSKKVEGFSKFSKAEKIEWITQSHFDNPENAKNLITSYNHSNLSIQKLHDDFVENSLTNFYLPLGVAPNFLINGASYTIPMNSLSRFNAFGLGMLLAAVAAGSLQNFGLLEVGSRLI